MGELTWNWDAVAVAIASLALVLAFLAHQEVRAQTDLSAASALRTWVGDIRVWANEVVDVLTAASALEVTSATDGKRKDSLVHLSALIDRGRLLLPNHPADRPSADDHKPAAFKGLRHGALDALVAAHRILRDDLPLENLPDHGTAIVGLRREFVSDVQQMIDPRAANRHIAKLLKRAYTERRADPTVGGLLPNESAPPRGAEATLAVVRERYRVEPW